MKEILSVGTVVFNDDASEVLLVEHLKGANHKTGSYGLPAGRVQEGEKLVTAALRELKEETGLQSSEDQLLNLDQSYTATIEQKGVERTFVMHLFLCLNYWGEMQASDETQPTWLTIAELDRLTTLPNVAKAVSEGRQKWQSSK